jgi:precorrin-6B methylase 2
MSTVLTRRLLFVAGTLVAILAGALTGTAASRQDYEPTVGQPGKDVVWVPTSAALVERMLDLAKVTPADFVMDLGSGDGRNIIAAAKRGARATGVEFNPEMVALSRKRAAEAGVADRATFVQGDMYEADISKATVLALFLLPSNLEKLKDKFLALPAGTRIVMNTFTIPGWEADATETLTDGCENWCTALLHIVPARVQGTWRLADGDLTLTQEFQTLSGTLAAKGTNAPISDARLRGETIQFSVGTIRYTGRVTDNRITGIATAVDGTTREWTATRVAP